MCRTGAVHWNIPKVEMERFWFSKLPCLSKSHKLTRNQPWKQCGSGPENAEAMKHSKPHVDISILVVIQLFRSVSSCPYRKDVLFVDTNLQQSEGLVPCEWACNYGGREFAQQQSNRWRLFWFCIVWRRHFVHTWGKNCHMPIITVMRVEISRCDCQRNNDSLTLLSQDYKVG